METHQLRYFLAVARTCNFSRAAEQCHVAQPSLSQQIMKLEAELGERLFERTRREVRLTPAGDIFRAHAERALDEMELGGEKVRALGGVLRGRVVLGALPTVAPYYLPARLPAFAQQQPEIDVLVHEDTTAQLVRAVLTKEVDVALVSLPVVERAIATEDLFDEDLLALLPASHRLSRKRGLTLADLQSERFILMQEGHCLAGQTLDFCRMNGFAPQVSFRSAQIETVRAFVAAGAGLSIVPAMARRPDEVDGVCYRPVAGLRRSIGVIYRNARPLSGPARQLVEFLRTA